MDFFGSVSNSIYMTLIYEDRYQFLLDGLGTTLLLTFVSFLLGTALGCLFCAMMCSGKKPLKKLAYIITQFFIQIPALVLLMLCAYVVFVDVPLPVVAIAIFCFTLKTGSYMADIFYTAMTGVNPGEVEAARSLGMSKFQTFRKVQLPQAVRTALPLYRNQFIQTLQETSIVGYIAIQDLTYASEIISSRTLDPILSLLIITVIYLLTGVIVSSILKLFTREKHIKAVA
ncbi:amino acid ABC transporter permease [Christensenellaceae bacterium OttesenSCG-928-K19]|nr:amino acid ABC transporter permease [Christensenellaceae bacterium OttesenSCG-928-K19]